MAHPLEEPAVVAQIARAASAHGGVPWAATGFTSLDDRASHPCGLLHGEPFPVFAKLDPGGERRLTAELAGLTLVRERMRERVRVRVPAPVRERTPAPIADGVIETTAGWILLLEAVPEVPPDRRTAAQWRSVGRSLALAHRVHGRRFGLERLDGFFGPLPQDNRPVSGDRWPDFYAERRLLPYLRSAVDAGHLPAELSRGVDRLITRLPALSGPEPRPSLLHGDAQQNNILTTEDEAVWVDASPYHGHPEIDLALLDYFAPVPPEAFDGYRDVTPIDPGFAERRELWRLFAYLAVITVDGTSPFGRPFLDRIAAVITHYR